MLSRWRSSTRESQVKIQFMSVLHLEVMDAYLTFDFPKVAPYLLLAGDIGRFSQYERLAAFLKVQCARYQNVFMVLGNHEFYGLSREKCLDLVSSLQEDPEMKGRLAVLNKNRIDLSDSVTLLGCILQSRITDESRDIVQYKVADFKQIKSWTVDDHNEEHTEDLDWLRAQIQEIHDNEPHRSVVIATHRAPVTKGASDPKYEGNPWSSAFSTDIIPELKTLPASKAIQIWIYGHTHWCSDFYAGNIHVMSNQRGYVINPDGPPSYFVQEPKPRVWKFWQKPSTLEFQPTKCISVN